VGVCCVSLARDGGQVGAPRMGSSEKGKKVSRASRQRAANVAGQ
jgi:hypothetical protein